MPGHLRQLCFATLSNAGMTGDFKCIVTPFPITDGYILDHTAAVVMGRPRYPDWVERYGRVKKRHGFRIIVDFDDVLFDVDGKSAIPPYNGNTMDPVAVARGIESYLRYVDDVTVSTKFLARLFAKRFPAFSKYNIVIVPNLLPRMYYGDRSSRLTTVDMRKPKVVYGGSPTHFSETDPGDFAGPWIPYLVDAVGKGEIELHMFGHEAPKFLGPAVSKVILHEPVTPTGWGRALSDVRGDIYLAPLAANDFNRAKSDLKILEAAATGMALLGSQFIDSPYSKAHPYSLVDNTMTVEGVRDTVARMCEKKAFNCILDYQRKYLANRILERDENIKRLMQIYCKGMVKIG